MVHGVYIKACKKHGIKTERTLTYASSARPKPARMTQKAKSKVKTTLASFIYYPIS
jgi:hypothetical protein